MHDRLAADVRLSRAATSGALVLTALVSVANSITGIVIIQPSAGGVSD
jgi:hypothetical protein